MKVEEPLIKKFQSKKKQPSVELVRSEAEILKELKEKGIQEHVQAVESYLTDYVASGKEWVPAEYYSGKKVDVFTQKRIDRALKDKFRDHWVTYLDLRLQSLVKYSQDKEFIQQRKDLSKVYHEHKKKHQEFSRFISLYSRPGDLDFMTTDELVKFVKQFADSDWREVLQGIRKKIVVPDEKGEKFNGNYQDEIIKVDDNGICFIDQKSKENILKKLQSAPEYEEYLKERQELIDQYEQFAKKVLIKIKK